MTFPDSPDTPSFAIPLNPTLEQLETWETHEGFDLWGFSCEGHVVESADPTALETPSDTLSAYIGRPVLLVMNTPTPRPITEHMPFDSARLAYPGGPSVRYPDFSPFLLVSDASLEDAEAKVWAMARGDLENKIKGCAPDEPAPPVNEWAQRENTKKLLMERFRPNVVVGGAEEPFGEDDWQEITTLGNRSFLLPARCPRCTVSVSPSVVSVTDE